MGTVLFVGRPTFETYNVEIARLCLLSFMGYPSFDPSSFLIDCFNVLHRLLLYSYLCIEAIKELRILFCKCTINFQARVCPTSYPCTVVQIGM